MEYLLILFCLNNKNVYQLCIGYPYLRKQNKSAVDWIAFLLVLFIKYQLISLLNFILLKVCQFNAHVQILTYSLRLQRKMTD